MQKWRQEPQSPFSAINAADDIVAASGIAIEPGFVPPIVSNVHLSFKSIDRSRRLFPPELSP